MTSYYMGIDPGWDRCGWGIVDDQLSYIASGVIQTSADWTYAERLDVVELGIERLIRQYGVQVVGVEKPYAGEKVGRRILEIGGAWGVILLAIHRCGCEYLELSNSHIKAAVARGGADKGEVRKGVENILGITLEGKLDDESDGLAAAVAARDDWRLAQMVKAVE